ncbi:MAG TPA: response regulator [Chloroflexaceae bacterium]|nr:response regulator [Chloroflexaceae bacterium]
MPRIMVINDTQEILALFRDILTEEGHEVALYSSAIHDMEEIERVSPALIILDFVFGNENLGFQMLQKIKMRRSTAGLPVIVCTAALQAVREMEGYLRSKGVQIVLKPFDVDDLIRAVQRGLDTAAYESQVDHADPPDAT